MSSDCRTLDYGRGGVRFVPVAAVLGLTRLGICWGCGGAKTASYKSNVVLPQEAGSGVPGTANQDLTAAQRARILAALESIDFGEVEPDPPGKAPLGVRWSDIPLALRNAANETGVEMVIVTTEVEPDRYVFNLKTIESWPGRLVIRRAGGGKVYKIEKVWIGRFPEEPQRVARAEKLVEAFEKELKRLGALVWFNDE